MLSDPGKSRAAVAPSFGFELSSLRFAGSNITCAFTWKVRDQYSSEEEEEGSLQY